MTKVPSARLALSLLGLCAAALLACGAPAPGTKCNTSGFNCLDRANAEECQNGVWVKLPCRGPAGCTRSGSVVSCDMSGDLPGDACASVEEGQGLCSSAGTALYECREGTIVQTRTCSTCSVSGSQLVCQP